MEERFLMNDNGEQCITSLQIAEVTGKTHAHVLRDIRNMELGWEKERGTKFGFTHTGDRHPVLCKLRTDEPVPVCFPRVLPRVLQAP